MTLVSSFIVGLGFTLGVISALFLCFVFASFCKGFGQAFKKSYREATDKKRAEKENREAEVKPWPDPKGQGH